MLTSRRTGCLGFTLIELMVVIAIIAALIGISLPTAAAVRDRAQTAKSLVQIKQILSITDGIAAERDGQAPISGLFWGYGPRDFTSRALGDNLSYYEDDGASRPVPFFAAVAEAAGDELPRNSRRALQDALVPPPGHVSLAMYEKLCTSPRDATIDPQDPEHSGVTLSGDVGYDGLLEMSSYLANGFVLGDVRDQRYLDPAPDRLRGRLGSVSLPSSTALIWDAEPVEFWRFNLQATLPFTPGGASFATYFEMLTQWWRGGVEQFDPDRHDGALAIGFIDGHANLTPARAEAFAGVFLSNP